MVPVSNLQKPYKSTSIQRYLKDTASRNMIHLRGKLRGLRTFPATRFFLVILALTPTPKLCFFASDN